MSEQGSGAGKKRVSRRNLPGFLTPAQLAARYGLSLQWAYHCKELQPLKVKIGKHVWYRIADIEALEVTDRDKATGAKSVPLDEWKKRQDEKRIQEAEAYTKFTM